MATSAQIDLGDFTCSICREIFNAPLSLTCTHCYCQTCLNGLKKGTPSSSEISPVSPTSRSLSSIVYQPKVYEANECFVCAICRKESLGCTECRDLDEDLKTLEGQCPHCPKSFLLYDLRKHLEECLPKRKEIDVSDIRKIFSSDRFRQLSVPQATALQQARKGANRSTFPCPFCEGTNFTVEDLCKHIESDHADADQQQVCPVCASMPWGDTTLLSKNVYAHLGSRHRFDYNTYVNYDQDEEAMISEAVERSMLYH